MKPDELSDAIGLVDEPLVEEANRCRRVEHRSRRWWVQWVAVAACLCLIAAGVFSLPRLTLKSPTDSSAPSSSTSTTTSAPSTTTSARPVVSKAKLVSQAVYPDRNKSSSFDAWSELRKGGYSDSFSAYYQKTMTQFLCGNEGENRVFSPANLYVSLAMLAETAEDNSRRQILGLLDVDDVDVLRKQARLLWEANYEDDQNNASVMANSLWMNKNLWYKENLLNVLSKNYYASSFTGEVGDSAYNTMLQNWINEQTGGILQDQVSAVKMDPSTVLNLVSTMYFGARWENEFDPKLTEQGVFHAASGDVPCEFMQREGRYLETVYFGNGYKALSVKLGGYGMYFFLPNEGVSVNDVLRNNNLFEAMHSPMNEITLSDFWDVKLSVPKFDVSGDFDLKSGLQELGVTDVFDSTKADFSPMLVESDGVAVSSVRHAARVMIDEEGCTAAAFTVMPYGMGAPESKGELDFVLDRPFVFCIADGYESILFAGVVEQP